MAFSQTPCIVFNKTKMFSRTTNVWAYYLSARSYSRIKTYLESAQRLIHRSKVTLLIAKRLYVCSTLTCNSCSKLALVIYSYARQHKNKTN